MKSVIDSARGRIGVWFGPEALESLLGKPSTEVEELAQAWLLRGGKRWRPLLTAALYATLARDWNEAAAHGAAVAMECFHKASLIHDDIEDGDEERYGQPTLYRSHGVPIAINVGDYLIGEGYHLLARLPLAAEQRLQMVAAAAAGHRDLCLGQGSELTFAAKPQPFTIADYERLCARKTGAAFAVALALGAIMGGADSAACAQLDGFSRHLGIAYQINDDLHDEDELCTRRPTILLALAANHTDGAVRALLQPLWQQGALTPAVGETLRATIAARALRDEARRLGALHRQQARSQAALLASEQLRRLLEQLSAALLERL